MTTWTERATAATDEAWEAFTSQWEDWDNTGVSQFDDVLEFRLTEICTWLEQRRARQTA